MEVTEDLNKSSVGGVKGTGAQVDSRKNDSQENRDRRLFRRVSSKGQQGNR